MIPTTLTQPTTLRDVLLHEVPGLSRDSLSVALNTALSLGQVLGKVTLGAATAAAKSGGNTGNGTIALDATTPILDKAAAGVYTVRCITAAANSGTFRVTGPDGRLLGDIAVGAAFANQIKFAIADGATDFVVGDGFDITIAVGSGAVKDYNPASLDGSQVAVAVSAHAVAASATAQTTQVIARMAAVESSFLAWPSGIAAAQQAAALAQLDARGIVVRTSI